MRTYFYTKDNTFKFNIFQTGSTCSHEEFQTLNYLTTIYHQFIAYKLGKMYEKIVEKASDLMKGDMINAFNYEFDL